LGCLIGCKEGIGKGEFLKYGAGGGAGHGGRGGVGIYNGLKGVGGQVYGDADLPCQLGSGSGSSAVPAANTAGGGLIGMRYSFKSMSYCLVHYILPSFKSALSIMFLSFFCALQESCTGQTFLLNSPLLFWK
jgi:hypothetical protein